MAGDWIKIEKSTLRKPEVLRISEMLSIDVDHAFGLCVRFWCWCDDHLTDGNAHSVTKVTLDTLLNRSGFSEALIEVGWLQSRNGSIVVPNFDRHLSQTAKNRSLTSQRVASHKKRKGNAASVSTALPIEEKRRVDNTEDSSGVCSEPPQTAASEPAAANQTEPPIMVFPCVGKGPTEWPLTASKLAEYGETYPGVDALAECRKALQWCRENPSKRKTFGGVGKFLNAWLSREQDRGRTNITGGVSRGGGSTPPGTREQQRETSQLDTIAGWLADQGVQSGEIREGDGVPDRTETHG